MTVHAEKLKGLSGTPVRQLVPEVWVKAEAEAEIGLLGALSYPSTSQ